MTRFSNQTPRASEACDRALPASVRHPSPVPAGQHSQPADCFFASEALRHHSTSFCARREIPLRSHKRSSCRCSHQIRSCPVRRRFPPCDAGYQAPVGFCSAAFRHPPMLRPRDASDSRGICFSIFQAYKSPCYFPFSAYFASCPAFLFCFLNQQRIYL